MSKKIIFIFWLIYLIALSIYWYQVGGSYNIILRNTVYLIIPLIATIAGIFSIAIFGFKGFRAKTLVFLTLGLACWFTGEILFYYYEFFLHLNPFPSIADFFYLIGYPLFFIALLNEIRHTPVNLKKLHPSLIFLFATSGSVLVFSVVYFGIFLAYDPKVSLFANLIAMGYGIGDLLLIMANIAVLVLAWEFRSGSFSRFWILFFIGFSFSLFGDILFAIFNIQYKEEIWFYKSLLDSLWMASYIFFANALFDFGASLLSAKSQLKSIQLEKRQ